MYQYIPINYIGKKLKTKREAENLFECDCKIFSNMFHMYVEMTHTREHNQ